ncbi:hypothetical protein ACT2CV_00365 [Pasteurellaceae bacterium 22721_9_1]
MIGFYRGQTLLSLMLSITLSSFLLFAIIQFYTQAQQQNRTLLLKLQLQTELQRAIQTMAKDIRRAGFRALSPKVSQDNFHLFEVDDKGTSLAIYSMQSAVKNNCVLFFYDLDANACLGSTNRTCVKNNQNMTSEVGRELFGYRLRDNILESRTYGNKANNKCKKAECQSYLQQNACLEKGWSKFLDEDSYDITDLVFSWLPEARYPAIEINLAGRLKQHKTITYETSIVVPLLNQPEEK